MLYGRGFLLTKKNKHLRSTRSLQRLNLDGVTTPCKFGERYGPYTSMVMLKAWFRKNQKKEYPEKEEYPGQFVQSSNWILCTYNKYVCVDKMQC